MTKISDKLETLGTKIKALRKSSPNPDPKVDILAIKAFDTLTDSMKGIDSLLVNGSEEQVEIYEKLLKATVDLSSNPDSNPEDYRKKMLEIVKEISALPNQKNQDLSNKIRDIAKKQAAFNFAPSNTKSRDIVGTALGVAALPFFNPVAIAALGAGIDKMVDAVNARRLMKSKTMNQVEKAEQSGEIQKYLREADLVREEYEDLLPMQTQGQSSNPQTQQTVIKKKPLRIQTDEDSQNQINPVESSQLQPNQVIPERKTESSQINPVESNQVQPNQVIPEIEGKDSDKKFTKYDGDVKRESRTKFVKIDKMEIGNLIVKKMTFPKERQSIGNVSSTKKPPPISTRKTSTILDKVKTSLFGEQKSQNSPIMSRMGTIAATLGINSADMSNEAEKNKENQSGGISALDAVGAGAAGVGAASLLKKGVTSVKNLVTKAKPFAIPAAIAYAASNAVDYGAGKLGIGKNEDGSDLKIDNKQDDVNWEKMSVGQKAFSGVARGIEKIGSFVGLDNFAKEAEASRIKSETEQIERDTLESRSKPVDDANWDRMGGSQKAFSGVARSIEKIGSVVGLDQISNKAREKRILSETLELEKNLKPVTIKGSEKLVSPSESIMLKSKEIVPLKADDNIKYDSVGNVISAPVDIAPSVQKMKNEVIERTQSIEKNIEEKAMSQNATLNQVQPIINNVTNNNMQGSSREEKPVKPASSRTSESSFKRWSDNSSFY